MTKLTGQNSDGKKAALQSAVVVTVDKAPEKLPQKQRSDRQEERRRCLYALSLLFIVTGLTVIGIASYYLYQSLRPSTYVADCTFVVLTNDSVTELGQHVEVSTDDQRESIQIPKFDDSDQAQFVHDFKRNISIIKDDTQFLCYVLPLDREVIPEPRTLFDLIYGLRTNRYVLDAEKIQAEYDVIFPAMSAKELEVKYGGYVSNLCAGYESHELKEVDIEEVTTTTMRPYLTKRWFTVYPGGAFMVKYVIYQ